MTVQYLNNVIVRYAINDGVQFLDTEPAALSV